MANQLIYTEDGSLSLLQTQLNETYHSEHGAVNESMHVFIDAGLKHQTKTKLKVFEVGFGTGLNALLTFMEAHRSNLQIEYTTVELYPIEDELANSLNYNKLIIDEKQDVLQRMHAAAWGSRVDISPNFHLLKLQEDFTQLQLTDRYDVIYFDAFSPDKQAEMWTQERFQMIYDHCSEGAVLVTYSAKGAVRRSLQAVGFQVERLAGPIGKREILRAIKK